MKRVLRKHWEKFLIIGIFLLPRFVCLIFLKNYPNLFAYVGYEPHFGQWGDDWLTWARQIASGQSIPVWEDMGMPLLMAIIGKLGIPWDFTFDAARIFLMSVGAFLAWRVYHLLKSSQGTTAALTITVLLSLYPRGIYYSCAYVGYFLPVYALAACALLLAHSSKIFNQITKSNLLIYLVSAIGLNFIVFTRSYVKLILPALVLALFVKAMMSAKTRLKPICIFVVILIGGFGLFYQAIGQSKHVFWHSLFRGLSDFDNKLSLPALDQKVVDYVVAINPSIDQRDVLTDPKYELTIKGEVLRIIKANPAWYLGLLARRTIKLTVLPRNGAWLPRLHDKTVRRNIWLQDLTRGFSNWPLRFYITIQTFSSLIDAVLVFIGFLGILWQIKTIGWRPSIPYAILLFPLLYIYILVTASYYDPYIGGSFFYLYSAFLLLTGGAKKIAPQLFHA